MSSISFLVITETIAYHFKPMLNVLKSAKMAGDEVVVVTSSDRAEEVLPADCSWLKVVEIPNASVFALRAHIPAIAKNEWVMALEDHSMMTPGTIDAIRGLIRDRTDIDLIVFLGKNLTSVSPWGWANFLHTFAFAWAPVDTPPSFAPVTAVMVRRSALMTEIPMREGEWELCVIPRIFASGRIAYSNDIYIDHIKPVSWPSGLALAFHNARAGAGLSRHFKRSIKEIFDEGWYASARRPSQIALALTGRGHELPSGVLWRMYLVGLAHLIGNAVGGLLGPGQSPHKID